MGTYIQIINNKINAWNDKPFEDAQYFEHIDFATFSPDKYAVVNEELNDRSQTPEYLTEQLEIKKQEKITEILSKATDFLGEYNKPGVIFGKIALYKVEEGRHIEATKANLNSFQGAYMAFSIGIKTNLDWTTYEDEVLSITDPNIVKDIALGIDAIQTNVWTVQYPNYLQTINAAQTLEELDNITISYTDKI